MGYIRHPTNMKINHNELWWLQDYVTWPSAEEVLYSTALKCKMLFMFFYPRDAMLARVFAIATCLSVCPSVCHTPVLCLAELKQDHEMYTV